MRRNRRRRSPAAGMPERPVPSQSVGMVMAFMLAVVMLPAGVQAAGQLVSIVDSDSDKDQVKIDAGKLRVGDGAGRLTVDGAVNVVGKVNVAGSVNVAGRATGFDRTVSIANQYFVMGPLPSYRKVYITSMIVGNSSSTHGEGWFDARATLEGRCSPSGALIAGTRGVFVVGAQSGLNITFPDQPLVAPFVAKTGLRSWCLYHPRTEGVVTTIVGYTI